VAQSAARLDKHIAEIERSRRQAPRRRFECWSSKQGFRCSVGKQCIRSFDSAIHRHAKESALAVVDRGGHAAIDSDQCIRLSGGDSTVWPERVRIVAENNMFRADGVCVLRSDRRIRSLPVR